ncbi:MAG TPA: ABC transporter ATP-binding protein [Bacteroidaceae bacterium]|nr:ABC transporter ATP-binding protein [Bacteroidaceae bacterium]
MEISIKNLNKIYPGGYNALHDVNLTIREGMFGLLGPNGAGKSTLMRILVTLINPTSGEIIIDGKNIQHHRREIRKKTGYLPQDFRFFTKLRCREFLDYSARLAGIVSKKERSKRIDEMLESVGLYEHRNRMANKLSGGMKRRLGIAQALIAYPSIIIVDEPTTGLDPEERIRFRNVLSDLSRSDIIIILSTHIVGDISSTCNHMALLNEGELIYNGTPDTLVENTKGYVWIAEVDEDQFIELKNSYPIISTIPNGNGWEVQFVGQKPDNLTVRKIDPNLEHAYVHYMDNKLNHWDL